MEGVEKIEEVTGGEQQTTETVAEPTVQEPEKEEVKETEEVKTEEPKEESFEIDYSEFSEVGTKEEIEDFLSDVIGEKTSKETKEAIKKILNKLQKNGIIEKETEEKGINVRNEVLANLPISQKEYNELAVWVKQQPKEYQLQIGEATNFNKKSKEEIIEAIKKAHNDRLNSVAKIPNVKNNSASNVETITKESVMQEYSNIFKTTKGAERKVKIDDLKQKVANSDLKDWGKIFFE